MKMFSKNKKAIETETLIKYLLWILLAIAILLGIKALFEKLGMLT